MAEGKQPKTKTIGYLPIAMVAKLPKWTVYKEKAKQLSALIEEVEVLKSAVRDAIAQGFSQTLEGLQGDLDFVEVSEKKKVRIIVNLRERSARGLDLSQHFAFPC
jgi:hypothetical protein